MNPETVGPGQDSWLRGRRFWEAAFIGVLVSTCAIVIANGSNPTKQGIAVVLLLCQVPAYLLWGRATVMSDRPHPRGFLYLLLVIGLFLPTTVLAPVAGFAMLALAPLSYLIVRPLQASGVVAVLNSPLIVSLLIDDRVSRGGAVMGLTAVVVGVGLSLAFGLWIQQVIEQSHERAELIRQLGATRAELAAVSRHAGALEERRHMAREIHDTLAQGFTSIIMLLRAAESSDGDHYVELARRTAQDNLDDARALVDGSLDRVRLCESLRRITDRLDEEPGIEVGFAVTGEERQLSV